MIVYDYHCRVYYRDIDKMGIVYYSRYLEYFEAARTELLRKINLKVTDIEKNGVYLPVITSHCEYKAGAGLEDDLIVKTWIPELPKLKLKIQYQIRRVHEDRNLVTGYTIHAFVTKKGKPIKPPEQFIRILIPFF